MNLPPLLPALFSCFLASVTFGTSPVSEDWQGQWKDEIYYVSADSGEHLLAKHWDIERKQTPLAPYRAIAAARKGLKRIVGDAEPTFECREVRIVDARGDGIWHYVVIFWRFDDSENKSADFPGITIFPFVVYLDGAIELPQKIDAN